MSRMVGTVSRGVRAPIIRSGDDLVEIVTKSVLEAAAQPEDGFAIRDRDVVAMTEAIVARAQGNYASVDDIAADVKEKLGGEWGGELRKHFSKERCSQTAMPFFAVFELYFGLFLSPVQNQMHR